MPVRPHLRVVADAAQQPVGDARRAPRAPRDLDRRRVVDRHVENPRGAADDFLEIRRRVELQPMDDAEPRSQRRRQQARPRRRADEREALEAHLDRPRARPLADDDVDLVVLERRIQDLFDGRRHPMDLVDEQHFAGGEIRDDPDQVAGLLDRGTGRRPDLHAHLVGDHVGQRRLAEPGRTVQQHVIERFLALLRRRDRHLQVLADAVLADVLVQDARAEPGFVLRVLVDARRGDDSGIRHASMIAGQIFESPYLASSRNACFSVRSKLPSGVALTAASTAFSESGR